MLLDPYIPVAPKSLKIGDYIVDAFLTEEHTYETDVSEYPIESGSAAVDHIRLKPIAVTVELIVSDSPIGTAFKNRENAFALEEAGKIKQVLPSDEALNFLLELREAREPITIITSIKTYPNMVMTSLNVPRDGDTGHALRATARFQQIIVIKNKRTQVQLTAEPRGKGKKSLGPKTVVTTVKTTWLCPRGVKTSPLPQVNLVNKCKQIQIIRTGKHVRYLNMDGTPLTSAEYDQLADNITSKTGLAYRDSAWNTWLYAYRDTPVSRQVYPSTFRSWAIPR